MKVTYRLKKLLWTLNDYLDNYGYYDDEECTSKIDGTEESCYEEIMKDEELHLLTSDVVKLYIDMLFNDWKTFDAICRECEAY